MKENKTLIIGLMIALCSLGAFADDTPWWKPSWAPWADNPAPVQQPAPAKPAAQPAPAAVPAASPAVPVASAPAASASKSAASAVKTEKKEEKAAKRPLSAKPVAVVGIYNSGDNCEAAMLAGKAVVYHPTMQAKGYGDNRIQGLKRVPSEADGCYLMDTAAGKSWVFLPQGTEVLVKDAKTVMLAACQNTIYEVRIRRAVAQLPAPVASAPAPVTIPVQKTIVETTKVLCKQGDRLTEAVIVNGKATCPELVIENPVKLEAKVVQPAPVAAPAAPSPAQPASAPCTDCRPEMQITKKVPRTDGRCVVALRDPKGVMHYARFDTVTNAMGSLLVGARVDDVRGEWNRSAYTPTYVGDGKQTVRLQSKDCDVVVNALRQPEIFAWTAPRLNLDANCKIVGRVREL